MKVIAVLAVVVATALAADWEVYADTGMTISIGVGFRRDTPTEGFLAGAVNGVGNVILHTTNGGLNWTQVPGDYSKELILLDLECADETVIVSGVFSEIYSKDDGKTFQDSVGGGQSQSVRYFGKDGNGGEKFGCAGTYFGKEGSAITTDGGQFFVRANDPELFTFARYGAYPSDDVFYLTAGEFPSSNDDDTTTDDDFPPNMARRAQKTAFQDENGHFLRNWKPDMSRYGNGTDNGYKAQLVKTTDGGKTWETQIAVNGTYYFNDIDCTTTEHCCAVSESSAPPYLGAGIHCTFDGGKTWNQTFYMPYTTKQGFSLMEVRFANDQLGWAAGSELGGLAPKAYFVETTDGGKTWNADKHVLFGYAALGLEVVNEQLAFATLDNTLTQQTALGRWTA